MLLGKWGHTSQKGVAGALEVDPSILCGILNDLEVTRVVERRRDPAGRRRHIVALTEEGSRVLAKAQEAVTAMEQEFFADVTPEELSTLRKLLVRVRTSKSDAVCAWPTRHQATWGHGHSRGPLSCYPLLGIYDIPGSFVPVSRQSHPFIH
ncbi:MarR family winged helix-turn-helix transcriptional regulator [Streptomyces sp. NPDC001970]